jgi:hypothetical protein
VSTDLDALCRPPDDFERRLYQVEKLLAFIEDCRSTERQLIRDLAHELADAELLPEDAAQYRKAKPVDLAQILTDAHEFLHDMHARYVTEREAARAGRELYEREREQSRAAHSLLARKGRVSVGE